MGEFNTIWIVDLVAIIIMLVAVVKDTRKGFIKGIFGLLISVASIAVAFLCADMVSNMTNGAFGLKESISMSLANSFSDLGLNVDFKNYEEVYAALCQNEFLGSAKFLAEIIAKEIVKADGIPGGIALNVYLGDMVGGFATNIVIGIVLFILCRLVLTIVEKVLTSLVEHIKLFDAVNTILGAVVGLLKGAIVVSLLCMLLSTVPMFGDLMAKMPETLFVYEWFFVNNPITKILEMFV